jgi:plasmid maintenance system antidote protein VapI
MTNTKEVSPSSTPLNHFPGDPNLLLDALIEKLNLKNDAALSRLLEVAPPVISKLRHGALPIGPTMLIRMHEVSDLGIREMRALMLKSENQAS